MPNHPTETTDDHDPATCFACQSVALSNRIMLQLQEWGVPCDRVARAALLSAASITINQNDPLDVVSFIELAIRFASPNAEVKVGQIAPAVMDAMFEPKGSVH